MVNLLPLQFGLPGGPEVLIILLIAVLLFGANKIPKLARSTGEAMGEFQKGREEVEQELQEMRDGATGESSGPETTTETDRPAEAATDQEPETTTESGVEEEDEFEFDIENAEADEETS